MDVTLSRDNTLGNFNFAARADDLTCAAACNVAGFANRRFYAERARIGKGNLNLRGASGRTYNADILDRFLFADYRVSFFSCELTGLGESFLEGQLMTGTEQNVNVFLAQMDMSCGCFDKYLCHCSDISLKIINKNVIRPDKRLLS